jgi:hypothetical protein
MGFQRSILSLKFADPELEGLVIKMKRLSMGDMMMVASLADLGSGIAEMREPMDQLMSVMADSIIEWNMEDSYGNPVLVEKGVPAQLTKDDNVIDSTGAALTVYRPSTGMYSMDVDLVMSIVKEWLNVATAVSPDLKKDSNSGEMSPELFSLMEEASTNLLN